MIISLLPRCLSINLKRLMKASRFFHSTSNKLKQAKNTAIYPDPIRAAGTSEKQMEMHWSQKNTQG